MTSEAGPMQIRPLRADEGLAYRDVRLRALEQSPESFAASLDEERALPADTWIEQATRYADAMEEAIFVVDRGNGSLGGTIFVRVEPSPPHDAYVGAMWVDTDLRAAGWAPALLEAAERFAARLGSASAELWVEAANERARRFFTGQGYMEIGVSQPAPQGGTALLHHKMLGAM